MLLGGQFIAGIKINLVFSGGKWPALAYIYIGAPGGPHRAPPRAALRHAPRVVEMPSTADTPQAVRASGFEWCVWVHRPPFAALQKTRHAAAGAPTSTARLVDALLGHHRHDFWPRSGDRRRQMPRTAPHRSSAACPRQALQRPSKWTPPTHVPCGHCGAIRRIRMPLRGISGVRDAAIVWCCVQG